MPNMKRDVFTFAVSSRTYMYKRVDPSCCDTGFVKASMGFGHPHGSELRLTFLLSNKFPQTLGRVITHVSVSLREVASVRHLRGYTSSRVCQMTRDTVSQKGKLSEPKRTLPIFSGVEPPLLHRLGTNRVDQ